MAGTVGSCGKGPSWRPPWGMFGSIQPQLHCRFTQGGKHDGTGLVSKQDLVSRARRLHRAEFLHTSQRLLSWAQTRAGTAVGAPGAVFGALVSAGGHVPWSPLVPVATEPARGAGWLGEQAGALPLPCCAEWAASGHSGIPESRSAALPTATKVPREG